MNGVSRNCDIIINRGSSTDKCFEVIRIPVEPKGTVYNFDVGKTVGCVGFTIYNYSRYDCKKAEFYAYFGKETNDDGSNILQNLKQLNGDYVCNVYTRLKDGYIYIYVSPLSIYDTLAIQITFAPFITFVEVLDGHMENYSDISNELNSISSYNTNLGRIYAIEENGWKLENGMKTSVDKDYPNHIYIRGSFYCTDNATKADGTIIGCLTNSRPTKQIMIPATYKCFNTNDSGSCCVILKTNGNIHIYGISSLSSMQLCFETEYYI